MIAPINAGTKPLIVKPVTKRAIARRKNALITKVNNPRVRMFIGSVRIRIKGLIKVLIIPRTRATMSAVVKELT